MRQRARPRLWALVGGIAVVGVGLAAWLMVATEGRPDPDSHPPLKLWINADSENHYVLEMSRERGECDLVGFASGATRTSVEEAWIFVKYANGKARWHEIGYAEERHSCLLRETPVLTELMMNPESVEGLSFYHLHATHRARPEAYSSEVVSHHDLRLFLKLMRNMDTLYPVLLDKCDFRVAVSSGIYIVKSSSEQLRKFFTDEDVARDVEVSIEGVRQQSIRARLGKSAYNFSQENRRNFQNVSSRWASDFSTPAYKIVFVSH